MAESNQSLTQEFYAHFQTTRADLTARLDALKLSVATPDALELLSLDVAKLRKELTDATSYLPSYDRRQCELRLKETEEYLQSLRVSSAPKSKFAFKRKANRPPPSAPEPAPSSTHTPDTSFQTSGLVLSGQSRRLLTISSLPSLSSSAASDITISDLDHCIVNLLFHSPALAPVRFTALHARNLSDCVLIMPRIEGSALLHDMTRCTIVLGCHQFRMHTSSNVDVHLAIGSNPIIEHCTAIRFAGYPSALSGISGAEPLSPSSHLAVQDFSHIRATPSPNWSALPDASTVDAEWKRVVDLQDVDVDAELLRLLPQSA